MGMPEITQNNVHIFIPYKAAEISWQISNAEGISMLDALREFYHSKTYEQLEIEKTKLWYESPLSLYEYYLHKK